MFQKSEMLHGATFSVKSMKVIAESIGLGDLPEDAAKELATNVSVKLKQIVNDSAKFMHNAKRRKLSITDIDHALKLRNIEPQYALVVNDFNQFRSATCGGRTFHFIEEKVVDLSDVIQATQPKIPLAVTLRADWFCVDGFQLNVPVNPLALLNESKAQDSESPIKKIDETQMLTTGKIHKLKNVETVHVKQLETHELSVEQQLCYKVITEGCVGLDDSRRNKALKFLSSDPGLQEMLPILSIFISDGVKVNVVQNNLALLIYLMRMVKALIYNPVLYLEKYLHELVPSIVTCIVSKQLCSRPELENHWALRDFGSRLISHICKNFNTSTNNLRTRVIQIFSSALQECETPLTSLYGALTGLFELGPEVVKEFIVPRIKFISDRMEVPVLGFSKSEKIAADKIRAMLQNKCSPVLMTIGN